MKRLLLLAFFGMTSPSWADTEHCNKLKSSKARYDCQVAAAGVQQTVVDPAKEAEKREQRAANMRKSMTEHEAMGIVEAAEKAHRDCKITVDVYLESNPTKVVHCLDKIKKVLGNEKYEVAVDYLMTKGQEDPEFARSSMGRKALQKVQNIIEYQNFITSRVTFHLGK